MVGKLTLKYWMGILLLLLFCLVMTIPFWKYGPAALELLQGGMPELAKDESTGNIYGLAALGLFFVLIAVALVIRGLSNSVGKRVRRYLTEHSGVTMGQLDTDFSAAQQIGNVWVGKGWTYSHDLNCIVVGNNDMFRNDRDAFLNIKYRQNME